MNAVVTRHADQHKVLLRGATAATAAAPQDLAPTLLVDVESDDFVAALGQAIRATEWPRFGAAPHLPLSQLAMNAAPRALFQPIHRRFNLLLLQLNCERFGLPRLDPRRIDSAGFVVRRWVGADPGAVQPSAEALAEPSNWQQWLQRDGDPLGWRGFADARDFDADPDPARRPLPRSGNARVDARLAALQGGQRAGEAANRLYRVDPQLEAHAGRSLLYGLVPTSEALRRPAAAVDYAPLRAAGAARDEFAAHLSPYLRQRAGARSLPGAGASFDASWLDSRSALDAAADDAQAASAELRRAQFSAFVRQMALEFDIGSSEAAAPAAALRSLLDEMPLQRGVGANAQRVSTADFVLGCARLVTDPQAAALTMPDLWGPPPAGWSERFVDAALDLLQSRSAGLRTLQGRFDAADATDGHDSALFSIRAFVRVKPHDAASQCPPQLLWSAMTPLYRIAPWYASTGSPQARIALPALDRASLAQMTPNVAFELPPQLQSLLQSNSPADLLDGKGRNGSDLGVGWLCSFSIPIITICAFVMLNLVLSLLDIFLRWMPLVKICLPLPRRK